MAEQALLRDRYRLIRLLGSGGYGDVFLALDKELQRQVTIKRLRAEIFSPRVKARFEQEARLMAALNHPNIAEIYDLFEETGQLYLVMAYCAQGSLKEFVERAGALTVAEIVAIGKSISRALAAAHEKGIIHRDIKPANILLSPIPGGGGVEVKLSDFGIAQAPQGGDGLTREGDMLGTPPYWAPEQVKGQAELRTDVYALGVLLYGLLAGRHYLDLQGADDLEKQRRIMTEMPAPLTSIRPDVPAWLEQVIMQTLQKDPRQRPSAAALYYLLESQGKSPEADPGSPRVDTSSNMVWPAKRPFWSQAALGAITSAVVTLLLVLAYLNWPSASAAPMPGYMPENLFPSSTEVVITGTVRSAVGPVNVRVAPDISSRVIAQLADGTVISLSAQAGDGQWLFFRAGDVEGWMNGSYVVTEGLQELPLVANPPDVVPATPPTTPVVDTPRLPTAGLLPEPEIVPVTTEPTITVFVAGTAPADGLRLRQLPTMEGLILAVLPEGTAVLLKSFSADGEWAQVTTDWGSGWVYAMYLADTPDVLP